MAEVIVSSLLVKFADFAFKESVKLYKVNDKVESVERELRWIHAFLKDADSKQKGDNQVQNWVKEVREVSFLIEDTIDTFVMKVENLSIKQPGILNTMKRAARRAMKLVAKHNLDNEINKIQARLKEIKESKERYIIKEELSPSGGETWSSSYKLCPAPDVDEIDLVGFEKEKDKIIELLLDENTSRRSVISIVGEGGLGKTTLAEKVYQSVKKKSHFKDLVWLTVSQEYKSITLLKKILENIDNAKFRMKEDGDEQYYKTECNKSLRNKRYFIILDDVWKDDLWDEIQAALPNNDKGSRVLMTTRFWNIAKAADPISEPCKLPLLSKDESLKLLLKKAFVENCPPDLLEPANRLSKQCGGLPLALCVVGGLLSTKTQNSHAWNLVHETLDWQKEGKKCTDIIASSYNDLPIHLKTCFIYLAAFPEDWTHNCPAILRLWIAEGFIPNDAPGTREAIAETYIDQLAQRCMVRVTSRRRGSIFKFRVHDLLLDLAIHEAKEKDFLVVFSKQNRSRDMNVARRASFQLDNSNYDDTFFTSSNARALFFFGEHVKVVLSNFQLKFVRVLVFSGCSFFKELSDLKIMPHLRCLMFLNCSSPGSVWFPGIVLFMDCFPKIQTLLISECWRIFCHINIEHVLSIKIPNSVNADHTGMVMQVEPSFSTNNIYKSVAELLSKNQNHNYKFPTENLCITTKENSWEQALKRLAEYNQSYPQDYLKFLVVNGRNIPIVEILDLLFLANNYQLEFLCLIGELQAVDNWPIKRLVLSQTYMDEHQMSNLSLFPKLEQLGLYEGSYNRKELIINYGFMNLRILDISLLEKLEEIHIEKGVIPKLGKLRIHKCLKLRMLPDLRYHQNLRVLHFDEMPEIFFTRATKEERYKINGATAINWSPSK